MIELTAETCPMCELNVDQNVYIKKNSTSGTSLYNSEKSDFLKDECDHKIEDNFLLVLNATIEEKASELSSLRRLRRKLKKIKKQEPIQKEE